jgi:hypothetical protein
MKRECSFASITNLSLSQFWAYSIVSLLRDFGRAVTFD